jgi:transcription antitermination factor NusG
MTKTKKPSKARTIKFARCDRCNELFREKQLVRLIDASVCEGCVGSEYEPAKGTMRWFAVSTAGSDHMVAKRIRERRLAADGRQCVGRVVIPRETRAKLTRGKYAVISVEGRTIGYVYADEADEALFEARRKFHLKPKGAYKPAFGAPEPLTGVRKVREGRRVVYEAMSGAKVLGRLSGMKSPKQAAETADRLYNKPQVVGPRQEVTRREEVSHVELVEAGGETRVKSGRSMPGYLLVEAEDDELVVRSLRHVPGVVAVLPYDPPLLRKLPDKGRAVKKAPTERDLKRLAGQTDEEGTTKWKPTAVPDEEVNVIRQPRVAVVNVKPGDKVRIAGGPFKGVVALVKSVGEDITGEITILGRPTPVKFDRALVSF